MTRSEARAGLVTEQSWAIAKLKRRVAELERACRKIADGAEPELEYEAALFRGLEDSNLQSDGYASCLYGFNRGVESTSEWARGIASAATGGK